MVTFPHVSGHPGFDMEIARVGVMAKDRVEKTRTTKASFIALLKRVVNMQSPCWYNHGVLNRLKFTT